MYQLLRQYNVRVGGTERWGVISSHPQSHLDLNLVCWSRRWPLSILELRDSPTGFRVPKFHTPFHSGAEPFQELENLEFLQAKGSEFAERKLNEVADDLFRIAGLDLNIGGNIIIIWWIQGLLVHNFPDKSIS